MKFQLAVHHPVIGVGVGGFKHAYAKQQHLRSKEPKAAASHDTPISVAAETGLLGLALLVGLFVAGLLLAFRRVAADMRGEAALVFGLVLASIGVHSLFYNAFFEDPMVWGALGLAALTSRKHKPAQPPELGLVPAVGGRPRHRAREQVGRVGLDHQAVVGYRPDQVPQM